MESQDARVSKLEALFKQKQEEMSSQLDTVLKAITGQLVGTLPSDTIKNPKLMTRNPTPQPPKEPPTDTNVHGAISKIDNLPTEERRTQVNTLSANAPIYNAMLEEPLENLKLGSKGSAYVKSEAIDKVEDPGIFVLP